MDEQRRAAWNALIRKARRREPVSPEERHALIWEGKFGGLGEADAEAEARCFVRYYLGGADLSDLPGPSVEEALDWFAMREAWGPEFQADKLTNMIEASEHDPYYWEVLNDIAIQCHALRRRFPARLADWDIEVRLGLRSKPPPPRGNRGQPSYAKDRRNRWIAGAFSGLESLGLGKMDSYRVIAEEIGMSVRTVVNAIQSERVRAGRVQLPWECWSSLH